MPRLYVICVALGLVGCGDRRTAELEHVRDAVCSCKTASCADDAMKALPREDMPSTPHTQHVARAMMDCLAKLYEAGRPSTDADAAMN